MEKKTQRRHSVYQMVTFRIIKLLEQDQIPWKKPWNNSGLPENIVSRKPYRGVNVILLAMLGYEKNYFISARQLKDWGGTVKEGEKPHLVTYWKRIDPPDAEGDAGKPFRVLRYYTVYNIQQCIGIRQSKIPGFIKPSYSADICKKIVDSMPNRPEIRSRPTEMDAYYNPEFDYIALPPFESFAKTEGYYGALFHELIHSTGHEKRLARKEVVEVSEFGSSMYSLEELTAEIGACYLKSLAGIPQRALNNNIAYLQGWIDKLNDNPKLIVYAATQAQKAVDYILNVTFEEKNPLPEKDFIS